MRGYRSAPAEPFLCKACREKDGKQHLNRVRALGINKRWPTDPFRLALIASVHGYIITQPRVTYDQAVAAWIGLNQPVEQLTIQRLASPETYRPDKRRRGSGSTVPARYSIEKYRGWEFPRTVSVFTGHYQYHTDKPIYVMGGSTYVLSDGTIFLHDRQASRPIDVSPSRLIVEMARKLTAAQQKVAWQGPPVGWE